MTLGASPSSGSAVSRKSPQPHSATPAKNIFSCKGENLVTACKAANPKNHGWNEGHTERKWHYVWNLISNGGPAVKRLRAHIPMVDMITIDSNSAVTKWLCTSDDGRIVDRMKPLIKPPRKGSRAAMMQKSASDRNGLKVPKYANRVRKEALNKVLTNNFDKNARLSLRFRNNDGTIMNEASFQAGGAIQDVWENLWEEYAKKGQILQIQPMAGNGSRAPIFALDFMRVMDNEGLPSIISTKAFRKVVPVKQRIVENKPGLCNPNYGSHSAFDPYIKIPIKSYFGDIGPVEYHACTCAVTKMKLEYLTHKVINFVESTGGCSVFACVAEFGMSGKNYVFMGFDSLVTSNDRPKPPSGVNSLNFRQTLLGKEAVARNAAGKIVSLPSKDGSCKPKSILVPRCGQPDVVFPEIPEDDNPEDDEFLDEMSIQSNSAFDMMSELNSPRSHDLDFSGKQNSEPTRKIPDLGPMTFNQYHRHFKHEMDYDTAETQWKSYPLETASEVAVRVAHEIWESLRKGILLSQIGAHPQPRLFKSDTLERIPRKFCPKVVVPPLRLGSSQMPSQQDGSVNIEGAGCKCYGDFCHAHFDFPSCLSDYSAEGGGPWIKMAKTLCDQGIFKPDEVVQCIRDAEREDAARGMESSMYPGGSPSAASENKDGIIPVFWIVEGRTYPALAQWMDEKQKWMFNNHDPTLFVQARKLVEMDEEKVVSHNAATAGSQMALMLLNQILHKVPRYGYGFVPVCGNCLQAYISLHRVMRYVHWDRIDKSAEKTIVKRKAELQKEREKIPAEWRNRVNKFAHHDLPEFDVSQECSFDEVLSRAQEKGWDIEGAKGEVSDLMEIVKGRAAPCNASYTGSLIEAVEAKDELNSLLIENYGI